MSTLFLFGAGASYGSVDCSPCVPPLGEQLFLALSEEGQIASSIDGEIKRAFRENFEKGMALLSKPRDTSISKFQNELALFMAKFRPGENNLYRHLLRMLTKKRVSIATTNYDLLIELVAQGLCRCPRYRGFVGLGFVPRFDSSGKRHWNSVGDAYFRATPPQRWREQRSCQRNLGQRDKPLSHYKRDLR